MRTARPGGGPGEVTDHERPPSRIRFGKASVMINASGSARGVVSLPYHHPFQVAERMVQLTRA